MSEKTLPRRAYLATVGAVAVGASIPSPARAATLSRSDYIPDHVETIEYDEEKLRKYRPRLRFMGDEYQKFKRLYGWVVRSSSLETDVCVYWSAYTHQEGVSDYDSHRGDHEPIYVFVRDGAVDKVVYSAYHWLRATSYNPRLDGTHPLFKVIDPWHQYARADVEGRLTDLGDLTAVFDSWLDEGLDSDLAPGTVVNPWLMTRRDHWWRRGLAGISLDATYVSLLRKLGAHKAEESDV